jgi:hypothetical protein
MPNRILVCVPHASVHEGVYEKQSTKDTRAERFRIDKTTNLKFKFSTLWRDKRSRGMSQALFKAALYIQYIKPTNASSKIQQQILKHTSW